MKIRIALAIALFTFLLSGCVTPPQNPVQLAPTAMNSKTERIGVAMKDLPKADTYFDGAGCLLCYGAASLANSSLTEHTRTLTTEDLSNLKNDVADSLRKKGVNVSVIPEPINLDALPEYSTKGPNVAIKDFSPLKKKYNVDKLLVISIDRLGMLRTYSSYIPTSDPKALLQGNAFLVNLANNTYEWYLPINIMKSSDEKWDEPPKFPGLTNAYFQALEIGKDKIMKPLKD
jgi:hypothetical protein